MPVPTISFATGSLGHVPLLEAVIRDATRGIDAGALLSYSSPLGLPELRSAVAGLLSGVSERDVLIVSSGQHALALAFDLLLEEDRTVLLQEPTYFGTLRLLRRHGARAVPFESFAALEEKLERSSASIVCLTSNFQNPTGSSLRPEEKRQLAEHARRTGTTVIEDNPYDALYYDERPNRVFDFAPERTIHAGGFSKILAPGLRVGYILASEETIERLKSLRIGYDIFTSTLSQQICAAALSRGYLGELRGFFKAKRDVALAALERHLGGTPLHFTVPAGGIFIQCRLPETISMQAVSRVAEREHGLLLEPDAHSYLDGRSRNTTRLNFVQNPDDRLVEGIRRLALAVEACAP